ncbi:hypothetical protein OSB04_024361 [Centaurea solstitialis]|uniref:Uncharacterized protein n=1 Tax=Centaurea solstitialis TaxID=347529 RepID=A0AA38WC02_9ASTR|nr:hypothetical protein OSB04_024361 [Centaurea solstitialis]
MFNNITSKVPKTPSSNHTKVMNCVTGGSDIYGMIYSPSKIHASQRPDDNVVSRTHRINDEIQLEAMSIFFNNNDLGDYNLRLESEGSSSHIDACMEEFLDCAQKPLSSGGALRKLDRVMVNDVVLDLFKRSIAQFLLHGVSNHSSCFIAIEGARAIGNRPSKCDNFPAKHRDFL